MRDFEPMYMGPGLWVVSKLVVESQAGWEPGRLRATPVEGHAVWEPRRLRAKPVEGQLFIWLGIFSIDIVVKRLIESQTGWW